MIWTLAGLALIACGILEYQAQYRAGVMRHLYYRKMEHLVGTYSPELLPVHSAFAIMVFAYTLYLWRAGQTGRSCSLMVAAGFLLLALHTPLLQELYTYTYVLYSLEIALAVLCISSIASDCVKYVRKQ
ncbi:hypothetical protein [Parendozoicomonas sp. Alg238-R29]|uniref:hypothetical protein n=1 Tax=Parendozoicomonas sp. Alg238-R29 TaxID=2993446 RepID=UPI00248F0298|nr:hypothetical protein [Parendozoicomonas sp. Alg238-R29]